MHSRLGMVVWVVTSRFWVRFKCNACWLGQGFGVVGYGPLVLIVVH
jgi:hypothetical protein